MGLILAEILCVSAFVLELSRALSGNTLSWAYVFEWPLFGGYALYMWRRMVRDELGEDPGAPHASGEAEAPDSGLEAYNTYLRDAHARETRRP